MVPFRPFEEPFGLPGFTVANIKGRAEGRAGEPMKAAVISQPTGQSSSSSKDVSRHPPVGDYDALCEMLYGATCTGTDQHLIARTLPLAGAPTRRSSATRASGAWSKSAPRCATSRSATWSPASARRRRRAGLDVNWGGFAEYGIAQRPLGHARGRPARRAVGGNRVNQVLPPGIDPAAATMIITWRETSATSAAWALRTAPRCWWSAQAATD